MIVSSPEVMMFERQSENRRTVIQPHVFSNEAHWRAWCQGRAWLRWCDASAVHGKKQKPVIDHRGELYEQENPHEQPGRDEHADADQASDQGSATADVPGSGGSAAPAGGRIQRGRPAAERDNGQPGAAAGEVSDDDRAA